MRVALKWFGKFLVVFLAISLVSGCAVKFQKRHSDDIRKIQQLTEELEEMNRTMALLQERLREEIARGSVTVGREDRGVVVTFVAEVLFDSGKAKIKKGGLVSLDKVASVLKNVENDVVIEGHTDNVPIKYSGWKDNWQLSTERALSVLRYLVNQKGLNPQKLSAAGYGEQRPVVSNSTPEGRQKNRRVEIVIKPRLERAAPSTSRVK